MAERMKGLERENRELRQANETLRVFEEKWRVNGVRKVWRQLGREGFDVARCTVARLMKVMGIQALPEQAAEDDDSRQETAVSARQGEPSGSRACTKHAVGVGFHLCRDLEGLRLCRFRAIRIVGWRVRSSAHAGFVLDALEQAVHERPPAKGMSLIHHSDMGSQGRFKRSSQYQLNGGPEARRSCPKAWCSFGGRGAFRIEPGLISLRLASR